MINVKEHSFLIGGAMVLVAAIVFAATVVWHDTNQKPTAANQTQVIPQDHSEDAFPHYPAGNVNGTITSVNGTTLQVSVLPPGATTTSATTLTVHTDKDTQIYDAGAIKDTAAYMVELDAYNKGGRVGLSPDPYKHVVLKVSDLKVGTQINVLPQPGSVQGTTMVAQTIMPLGAPARTSTTAH